MEGERARGVVLRGPAAGGGEQYAVVGEGEGVGAGPVRGSLRREEVRVGPEGERLGCPGG